MHRSFQTGRWVAAMALLALVPRIAQAAPGCAPAPPVVSALKIPSYYGDKAGSVEVPALKAQHDAAVEPLTLYVRHVASDADNANTRQTPKAQAEAAHCALDWMQAWAAGNGWLGKMSTKQAEYQRKWDLAGVALAYLKVRRFATPDQRQVIEPWLQRWADAAHAFFNDRGHTRNNHWYWLGLGETAVGLATDSPRHWDIGRGIMSDAARDIAADGTLPAELARKRRALHYHGFSLMPLVIMAELAAKKGEDWYAMNSGALHKLVAITNDGLQSPALFDRLAGARQEQPVNAHAGWLQAYQKRFPDRLKGTQPRVASSHRWLGGNVEVLLGVLKK
jgi:poly(beta-D-mannuronate) lyase